MGDLHLLCGWAKGQGCFFLFSLSLPLLVPWACLPSDLGKWIMEVGRKHQLVVLMSGLSYLSLLPLPELWPCLAAYLPLWELSSEAGVSERKNDEGLQG